MQTETALPMSPACSSRPSILNQLGWNRLLLGGVALALIAAGLAWQWSWLVAIGMAPLLVSVAPCLAMCALGLCMHRMSSRTDGVTQEGPTTRPTSETSSVQQET
jgi:hypothetical protein